MGNLIRHGTPFEQSLHLNYYQPCWLVGLLVCQQDFTQTTEHISMKPGWRTCLGLELIPLTSGADLSKETDPGLFSFHFL